MGAWTVREHGFDGEGGLPVNRWKQTRLFTCMKCRAVYLHDLGYFHACFCAR